MHMYMYVQYIRITYMYMYMYAIDSQNAEFLVIQERILTMITINTQLHIIHEIRVRMPSACIVIHVKINLLFRFMVISVVFTAKNSQEVYCNRINSNLAVSELTMHFCQPVKIKEAYNRNLIFWELSMVG